MNTINCIFFQNEIKYTRKKTKNWLSKPIITKCSSKILQNAPFRLFLSIFDLPLKTGFPVTKTLLLAAPSCKHMRICYIRRYAPAGSSCKAASIAYRGSMVPVLCIGPSVQNDIPMLYTDMSGEHNGRSIRTTLF